MLLTEYNEQAHIEYEKEISYEDGKIEGAIQVYQEFGLGKSEMIANLVKLFGLSEAEAQKYVEQYQL